MASLTLKNASGKDAGSVDLDDAIFGLEPNVPLMHQVVTAQLAARRAGTQSAKTRAEVRGGGRKPYAQKGTGNARQGSIRAPQFAGGGVALAPKPRSYSQKTPKKMIKAALRSALSDRAAEGKVIVVDSYGIDAPKTKDAKALLAALDISGTVLVVVGRDDANAALSFRNLPHVQVISPGELNTYDVLCNDWLVFSKDVVPASDAQVAAPKAAKPAAKLMFRRTAKARTLQSRATKCLMVSPSRATPARCSTTFPTRRSTTGPSQKCGSPPKKPPRPLASPARLRS